MIITTAIRVWLNAIIGIIELLPQLPNIPQQFTSIINQAINFIFQYGALIMFFLPPKEILILLVSVSIALEIFAIGYWITMWILQKIPFLNIH